MSNLPAGWAETTVGEVMRVAYGKALSKERRTASGSYSYVGSGGPIATTDDRLTKRDTIVVGRKGTAGSVARYPNGCWPSDTTFFLESPDGLDARLVELQLRAAQLGQHDRSTALPGLGRPDLETAPLAIPPRAEQERIVAAIEEAFAKLDAGEAGLRTVRQRLQRMRESVLTAAVSSECESRTLGDLLVGIEAGKSFATEGRPTVDGEVGVIKVSAMTWGVFREEENKALPPRTEIDPRWRIRQGDLLFSRANTRAYVGAAVLVQKDHPSLILSDKSLRLLPGPELDRRWLLVFLRSRVARRQIEELATGTKESMRNISQAKLRGLAIPLPPLEQQEEVVAEVERLMSFIEAGERAVDAGLTKAAALRRSVLKVAFEGKLVPQDPNDEPASELLERIRAERAGATG